MPIEERGKEAVCIDARRQQEGVWEVRVVKESVHKLESARLIIPFAAGVFGQGIDQLEEFFQRTSLAVKLLVPHIEFLVGERFLEEGGV
jgi:hypothetical protein